MAPPSTIVLQYVLTPPFLDYSDVVIATLSVNALFEVEAGAETEHILL